MTGPDIYLKNLKESDQEVKRFNIFDHIRSVDLHINDFSFYDQSLVDHRFVIDRGENEWLIEAYGSQLDGLISIPYDFLGDDPLMLKSRRWPGRVGRGPLLR